MGIQLARGRDFTEHDNERAQGAVVINETMARRFWPGPDPVEAAMGKRLKLGKDWLEIVGVAKEVKQRRYGHLTEEPPAPRAERADLPAPCWIRLEDIPNLPLWPKEMKALATTLLSEPTVYGVSSFVSQMESPWETPGEPVAFNLRVKTRD